MKLSHLFKNTVLIAAAGMLAAGSARTANLLVGGAGQATVALGQNLKTTNVQVTSSDGSPIQFVVSTRLLNPGLQWLCVGVAQGQTPCVQAGVFTTPATLVVLITADLSSFGAGPFSGTYDILPASGNGVGAVLQVTDTPTQPVQSSGSSGLAVTTNSISLSYATATGTSQPASVAVSGVSSYGAKVSTANNLNWLQVSDGTRQGANLSGLTAATLTVGVGPDVSQLSAGSYQGSILLTGSDNSQQTITVTLSVSTDGSSGGTNTGGSGSGGNSGNTGGNSGNTGGNNSGSGGGNTSSGGGNPASGPLIATPSALAFNYQTGSPVGQVPSAAIVITSPVGATYEAQADQAWLVLGAPTAGAIPGSLVVAVNPGGLAPNAYTGHVTITSSSGTTSVTVQLLVSVTPVVSASPAYVKFSSDGVTTAPAAQDVVLSSSDGTSPALTGVTGPAWVTATVAGNTVHIVPKIAGLAAGLYSDNVVVRVGGLANGSISIPVVMVVGTGAAGTGLTLSSSSLSFQGTIGGPTPNPSSIQVTVPPGTVASAQASDPWISINPPGAFSATQVLTVWVSPVGLSASVHSGAIILTANGSMELVPVTFTLTAGSSAGTGVNPGSLNLIAQAGGSAVNGYLTVSLNAYGIAYSASTATSWLKVTPAMGTTQSSVTATADPSGLAPGVYQGSVSIKPGTGAEVDVPVTFTVAAAPTISAPPSSLTFSFRLGSSVPPGQTVPVSGTAANLAFTAQAASSAGWLSVSPNSGTTPASVNVTANPAGLAPGTYQGTVTLTGANGAAGQSSIGARLSVLPPFPTISRVANAASLASGPVAPGEIVTISGVNIGPETEVTAQPDASGNISTQLGGVQVLIDGFPCPIMSASSIQVTAMVPYEVAGFQTATILVEYQGQTSNALVSTVTDAAPGIYTQNALGVGPAGFDSAAAPVGPGNPVSPGGYVTIYLTGTGQTIPAGVTGKVSPHVQDGAPLPLLTPVISIGGLPAAYSYAGGVPGKVEGLMQINLQVPPSAPTGDLPLVVSLGSSATQPGVTVSIR